MNRFAIFGLLPSENLKEAPIKESLPKEREMPFQIDNLLKIRLRGKLIEGYFLNLPDFSPFSFSEKLRCWQEIFADILYAHYLLGVEFIYFSPEVLSLISRCYPFGLLNFFRVFEGFEDIYFTDGNTLTAATICQIVKLTINSLKLEPQKKNIVIVGAHTIIGEAVSQILVPQFNKTTLIAKSREQLNRVSQKLLAKVRKEKFEIATLIQQRTDIVIKLSKDIQFNPKKESVSHIFDFSEPENIIVSFHQDLILNWQEEKFSPNLPLIDSSIIPVPMAEVIMQSLEEYRETHLGEIDIDFLHQTEKWTQKYGLVPLGAS